MMPYTTRFHIIKRPFQSSTNESLDSLSKYIIRFIIRFNRSQYIFKNTFFIHILNIYSNSLSQCVPMGVSRRCFAAVFFFFWCSIWFCCQFFLFADNVFYFPAYFLLWFFFFSCNLFLLPRYFSFQASLIYRIFPQFVLN